MTINKIPASSQGAQWLEELEEQHRANQAALRAAVRRTFADMGQLQYSASERSQWAQRLNLAPDRREKAERQALGLEDTGRARHRQITEELGHLGEESGMLPALAKSASASIGHWAGHLAHSHTTGPLAETGLLAIHELVTQSKPLGEAALSAGAEVTVTTGTARLFAPLVGEGPAVVVIIAIPLAGAIGRTGQAHFDKMTEPQFERARQIAFQLDPEGIDLIAVRQGCKVMQIPDKLLTQAGHALVDAAHAAGETAASMRATMEQLPPYK